MVMHPQFIKNLGEHLAQEFFNMNQEYCANSQIEISESDRSEKQHSQSIQQAAGNIQNSHSTNAYQNSSNTAPNERNQKVGELKSSDRPQSSLSQQAKKQTERKGSKDDQNQRDSAKMSPRRQGSQPKKLENLEQGGTQAAL